MTEAGRGTTGEPRAVGIWASGGAQNAAGWGRSPAGAARFEELGYSELWISGGAGDGLLPAFGAALAATRTLTVASGIVSIYHCAPATAISSTSALQLAYPERFILGLGVSHGPSVERLGQSYDKPYSAMVNYLDTLDAANPDAAIGARAPHRMLAALGDRMLRLSAERSIGAHPYFVPVEHTAHARSVLGQGPRLAPEQAVVVETNPTVARAIARRHMAVYLTLPNYVNNLRRLGWAEEDLAGAGSDKLVDAIVAWGDAATVAARVRAHHDAGADIVLMQILVPDEDATQEQQAEQLASELFQ